MNERTLKNALSFGRKKVPEIWILTGLVPNQIFRAPSNKLRVSRICTTYSAPTTTGREAFELGGSEESCLEKLRSGIFPHRARLGVVIGLVHVTRHGRVALAIKEMSAPIDNGSSKHHLHIFSSITTLLFQNAF
jgi:hypothetical protein